MDWDGPTSRLRVGGWLGNTPPPAQQVADRPDPPAEHGPTMALPDLDTGLAVLDGEPADPLSSSGSRVLLGGVAAVAALALVGVGAWWVGGWNRSEVPAFTPAAPLSGEPFLPVDTRPGAGSPQAPAPQPGVESGNGGALPEPDGAGPSGAARAPSPARQPAAAPVTPLLTVTGRSVPRVVDLTAEGDLDWVHWGRDNRFSVDRKRGGPGTIVDHSGAGGRDQYDGSPERFAWSDGTPTAAERGTRTGVNVCGVNGGFVISVPAGPQVRTLRFYGGVSRARGRLDVVLGGLSRTQQLEREEGTASTRWAITFRAPAGTQLVVRWSVEAVFRHQCPSVNMQAATLSERNTALKESG